MRCCNFHYCLGLMEEIGFANAKGVKDQKMPRQYYASLRIWKVLFAEMR